MRSSTALSVGALFVTCAAGCTLLAGVDDIEYGAKATSTSPATPGGDGSASAEGNASGDGNAQGNASADADAGAKADANVIVDAGADAAADANANPDPGPVVPDPDPDPGPAPVVDEVCTDAAFAANDKRGALELRLVTFPALPAAAAKYSPSCLRIKSGQSVTFAGNFAIYPLAPMGQGAAASPIAPTAGGATASFTFPAKGRFGFGSVGVATMRGTIDVK